ncbi:UNVERIFIED_CONTAM: hypothetical protein PYX00_000446 [Menopon gallinae]|uniref:Maternal protein exuperantia n=1 Tax=Menopon gallinae TaxID=328185 RepID=A0AAW2I970_9NEOP
MVSSTTVKENGVETQPKLPPGKYRIVGFDVDLTGRRLIDEICYIAAYTPNIQFSQYVMPFRDLNTGSKHRHFLRVATVGRYRMLKCTKTGEVLKTKSEISAVSDFLQWLEDLKAEGVILVTHDASKTVPPFLLGVLRKYNLFERFTAVVKGFANSFMFAKEKCERTVQSYSLPILSKVLLGKDEEVHSAVGRARLAYQIVQHLCAGEDDKGSGDATSTTEIDSPAMSEALRQIATTIADEEKELAELKELVVRQNSFRPIFGEKIASHIKTERNWANNLRRLLAEANLTYENLVEAWNRDKKESLLALVRERVTNARKPEDIDDLTEILLCHFDPEHFPKFRQRPGRRNEKTHSEMTAEAGDGEKDDKSKSAGEKASKESAGTTESAASSPVKSAGEKTDEDASR